MKRAILVIVGIGIFLFVAIQFIPVEKSNPPVSREIQWDSPQTKALAQRACYDCHSNETVWPWYASISPVSLILSNHVNEGRQRLNFSTWDQPNSDLRETEENIRSGRMPLWDYVLMHPTAKLSAEEQQQLIDGLNATYQLDPPISRPERFGRGGEND